MKNTMEQELGIEYGARISDSFLFGQERKPGHLHPVPWQAGAGEPNQPSGKRQLPLHLPRWTDDSVFQRVANGNFDIFLVDFDGTNLIRIIHHPDWDGWASFVPVQEEGEKQ